MKKIPKIAIAIFFICIIIFGFYSLGTFKLDIKVVEEEKLEEEEGKPQDDDSNNDDSNNENGEFNPNYHIYNDNSNASKYFRFNNTLTQRPNSTLFLETWDFENGTFLPYSFLIEQLDTFVALNGSGIILIYRPYMEEDLTALSLYVDAIMSRNLTMLLDFSDFEMTDSVVGKILTNIKLCNGTVFALHCDEPRGLWWWGHGFYDDLDPEKREDLMTVYFDSLKQYCIKWNISLYITTNFCTVDEIGHEGFNLNELLKDEHVFLAQEEYYHHTEDFNIVKEIANVINSSYLDRYGITINAARVDNTDAYISWAINNNVNNTGFLEIFYNLYYPEEPFNGEIYDVFEYRTEIGAWINKYN